MSILSTELPYRLAQGVGMKMPPSLQLRNYYVVATDPDADWDTVHVTVRAISRDEARRVARAELAKQKRDHFGIERVLEAEAHERLDTEGMLPP